MATITPSRTPMVRSAPCVAILALRTTSWNGTPAFLLSVRPLL
jgi:hypothetical protein